METQHYIIPSVILWLLNRSYHKEIPKILAKKREVYILLLILVIISIIEAPTPFRARGFDVEKSAHHLL
jgi:hypothetical protein